MPLVPGNRRPLLGPGGPPPMGAAPPGPPPPGLGDPSLGGGLPPGGPPPMGGDPSAGIAGLLGGQLAGAGGLGGPQFPSTDPSTVSGLLQQDQQAFQSAQMEATVLALIDAMRSQPNPAAQAAMTEPGYPTPPPADGVM